MILKLTTAPVQEPLTLEEVKLALRVLDTSEDDLITSNLKTARARAEDFTGRAFLTQTWKLYLDQFPSVTDTNKWAAIEIPRPPLQTTSFQIDYVDTAGVTQTLTVTTDYTIKNNSEPGYVVPAYGESWPSVRDVPEAVTITFKAGWTSSLSVPEDIKRAILEECAFLYEHRGDDPNNLPEISEGNRRLLWPHRVAFGIA